MRSGFTLIETVMSALILGTAMVAVLNTVGSSRLTHAVAANRQVGMVLAEELMAEILSQTSYKEGNAIGMDSGENNGNRSQFDDIDDYHGWVRTPPTDRDGNSIAGANGFTREVSIDWRASLPPNGSSSTDQGLKRIVVTVKRGDIVVAELTAFRSDNCKSPEENY